MAPLEHYLMPRAAEIALARSAAPESIAHDAEVLVLERHGFVTAIRGTNGFVCMVLRSWASGAGDPEFWNPNLRAPICYNATAARFCVPLQRRKTEWILAGCSQDQMRDKVRAALANGAWPKLEPAAMCFMMSKQGHLNDRDGAWLPHLMFFVPKTDPQSWGANLPGSPLIAFADGAEEMTTFLVPVRTWSDGSPAPVANVSEHKTQH